MVATPQYIPEYRGFSASFTRGNCGVCDHPIRRGDDIRYSDNTLVRRACCENEEPLVGPTDQPSDPRPAVMPPGKTKVDLCNQCFLIHTAAQGDECF